MIAKDVRRVFVLGAGTMGQQTALHFAVRGCDIAIYDLEDAILERAMALIRKASAGLVRQGYVPADVAEAALGRMLMTAEAATA